MYFTLAHCEEDLLISGLSRMVFGIDVLHETW
jgi:hypothetical protein